MFVPAENSHPTPTLIRKWFHTVLMKYKKMEKKLYRLLLVIDGHSENVTRKHYSLKDPEEHANLAKELVFHILRPGPADWPAMTPQLATELETVAELQDRYDRSSPTTRGPNRLPMGLRMRTWAGMALASPYEGRRYTVLGRHHGRLRLRG